MYNSPLIDPQAIHTKLKWLSHNPAKPTKKHLAAYGAVSFLAARDSHFCNQDHETIGKWFMPAIITGQFNFMFEGSAPRWLVTWAFLGEQEHNKFLSNLEPPPLSDWMSGDNIWIMSILAPYRHCGKRSAMEWVSGNTKDATINTWRSGISGKKTRQYEKTSR
jgi:hemolysin-activating ACP:hemolysin acyltransferase